MRPEGRLRPAPGQLHTGYLRRSVRGTRGSIRAVLLALLAGMAHAAPPVAYEARYGFERYGVTGGVATQRLSYPGQGRYRLEVAVKPTGIARLFTREEIFEESTGVVDADGHLHTQRYQHRRVHGRERYRDFRFDHEAGRLRDAAGGIPERELPSDLTDDLVQLERLRHALATGARELRVRALYGGKGRVEEYHYRAAPASETITTPAGRYETVRVVRTDGRGRYRLELWCAPELDFLPVRMDRYRKGTFEATMRLQDYRSEALPPS